MNRNALTFLNLNQFLAFIHLKKQHLKNIKPVATFVKTIDSKKIDSLSSLNPTILTKEAELVAYIVDIKFSRSNTLLHVMDFTGKLKAFYSAGSVGYSGKNKKSRYAVFRDLHRILTSNLLFLKGKPISLHLTNARTSRFWIIKKMKKRFFVVSTKVFNSYPHNGCRKRKVRRKKFKKKR